MVNFKACSGKTTTVAQLAQNLTLPGHRVLAIVLDPQTSLTSLFGIQPEIDQFPSLYGTIRYDEGRKSITAVIRHTNFPGLDVVPASLKLQVYEYYTPLATQSKTSGEGKVFWNRIGKALQDVDGRYDLVVVDCPPQLGSFTLTALAAVNGEILELIHTSPGRAK